ncbi:WhiB family transcriptional regulator [Nocardioides sp. URHA0032]|uniref:WhiB family transcriptional regulator n=1 Tax=Nocardioides sp. URHA0032 TaxID=1380388 RepID=UPI00068432C5
MHEWSTDARCLHEDPELFFPRGEGSRAQRQIEAARVVCASCPVRGDCLAFAVTTDAQYGVWAGTTPRERRRLRRRAGLAASPRRVVRRTLAELSQARDQYDLTPRSS